MSLTQAASGTLQHFSFDNMPVRGMVLRIEDLALHVATLKHGNTHLNNTLSDMMMAAALLTSDLKHKANVTIQLHSEGAVPLIVAQCDKEGDIRAYANIANEKNIDNIAYEDIATKEAIMTVSVEQGTPAKIYQSLVKVNNESIASSLEQYFNDSVQLKTYFRSMAGQHNGEVSSGAIFLQALPNNDDPHTDDWTRLNMILGTIEANELLPGNITVETLLMRLFAEDKVRVHKPEVIHFDLAKNRKRMETALKSVGAKECKEILAAEGGKIIMTCEFSGRTETFTEEDLRGIFGTQWDAE